MLSSTGLSEEGTSGRSSDTRASAGNDRIGRWTVHTKLRSILMSPTSFTLFRGFNHDATQAQAAVNIDGLQAPPDFFDSKNDSSEFNFGTFYSGFFNPKDESEDEPRKKKRNVEGATRAETLPLKTKSATADDEKTAILNDQVAACVSFQPPDGVSDAAETYVENELVDTAGSSAMEGNGNADGITSVNEKADAESKKAGARKIDTSNISETDLTGWLQSTFTAKTRDNKNVLFSIRKESSLEDVEGSRGRTYLRFCPKKNEQGKQTLLGLVEFGLLPKKNETKRKKTDCNESTGTANESKKTQAENDLQMTKMKLEQLFWEKANLVTNYLPMARRDDGNWKWQKSMLMGVFVASTRDCQLSRFAVFACEPKGTHDWRMALMWRSELVSIEEQSEAFGAYLRAVNYLAGEDETLPKSSNNIEWIYLGPNCTLVTIDGQKYVARSFDNRCRHSFRTPRVYKNWEWLRVNWQKSNKPMIDVLTVEDDENTLEFAAEYNGYDIDLSMLFSTFNGCMGGKVEVIAVPYEEGTHECTCLIQLLSLLIYMERMQKDGFLHGDMRGRNMVFMKAPHDLDISQLLPSVVDKKGSNEQQGSSTQGKAKVHEAANVQQVAGELQGATNQLDGHAQHVADDLQGSSSQARLDDHQLAHEVTAFLQASMDKISADAQQEATIVLQYLQDLQVANEKFTIQREEFKYACLIDFDFGGKWTVDNPIYPTGYQVKLDDGDRGIVKEGDAICPVDDIVAAANVFGQLHKLRRKSSDVVDGLWNKLLASRDLSEQIECAAKLLKVCGKNAICPTDDYKTLLGPTRHTILQHTEPHLNVTEEGGNKMFPARVRPIPLREDEKKNK